MYSQPGDFVRPLIPNGKRRAKNHDYHSRGYYMITINAAPGIPRFSTIVGTPGDHDYPPYAQKSDLGLTINCILTDLRNHFPVRIHRRTIMPEHIHFVIFVCEYMKWHLGDVISYFKAEVTRAAGIWKVDSSGNRLLRSVFETGYNDRIVRRPGQLQKMLNYVSDNPRRRLMKMMNPGFHHISHLYLAERSEEMKGNYALEKGLTFKAYGNIDLLMEPDLEAVKIGRELRSDPAKLIARKRVWQQTIETGGVIVSPFIHEDEKRVRDWAVENGGRLILIRWEAFGERYKPSGRYFDLCSEGRLLEISFGGRKFEGGKPGRRECMLMNELAAAIAADKLIDPSHHK